MKISLKETEAFDAGGFKGNLYVDKKDGHAFNALLIECVERHFKMKLTGATRVYFVVEGSGDFIIDGVTKGVRPRDLVIIPDSATFEYSGAMTLFEFNVPATDESNEKRAE